ncbi:hypothetical protein Y032_0260g514 [Ancylostoma ceylanicum]|uniref:Uncharacterized protein n=1 Tax=Ancylostoma ceylanicum TaxID=53326 RepID=A0A016SBC1_9BILA|nr:hypothetical protein Y032_0260g514 [Ancylostoma ceylanicum]
MAVKTESLKAALNAFGRSGKQAKQNINSIVQLVGSVSGPATKSLGDVLERSAATLEELNTLSDSVKAETNVIRENLQSIESQLSHLEKLWPSIDRAVEFVAQKKQQLSELERLCTSVERQLAERLSTRSGKYDRAEVSRIEKGSPAVLEADPDRMSGDVSDSEAPVEISSKMVPDIPLLHDPEPELSLFEQLQERKREQEESRQDRAQAKKRRRIKKVDAGQFIVKAKKAEFKVLTLNEGLKKSLEPTVNFREQLLRARTDGKREKDFLDSSFQYRMPLPCVRNGYKT